MAYSGNPSRQDWALIALRLGAVMAANALVWLLNGNLPANFDALLTPSFIVLAAAVVMVVGLLVRDLQDFLPAILLVTGAATAGGLTLMIPDQIYPLLGGLTALAALDVLRLRWPVSFLAPVAVIGGAGAALYLTQPGLVFDPFIAPIGALVVASLVLWGWGGVQSRWGDDGTGRLKRQVASYTRQLEDAREMMRAVVEVSTALSSQSTVRVLEQAMTVGQLALRKGSNAGGIVSIIFLYSAVDDSLQIFDQRGLNRLDLDRVPAGKAGVIGEALAEAAPVIGGPAAQDPELSEFGSLARTQSLLAIPLRAEYVNYGVMVFASADENAFTADRLDLMTALGTQITVSLQNATLYNNLKQEKERLMQVETNARQALVRDMHDIPTQTISAVTMKAGVAKLMVERNKTENLLSELNAIEAMARQASEEIRHVLFKLRPLALESQGVSAALDQLAEKTRKTYGQNVVLRCDERVDNVMEQEAQDSLFFIIEEAVSNARKYAKADTIRIDVQLRDEQVWARVADNGQGFDLEATQSEYENRGSFGMINLRERAELVGGRMSIQSQIGKGTAVTVTLPLSANEENAQSRQLTTMRLGARSSSNAQKAATAPKPPQRRTLSR